MQNDVLDLLTDVDPVQDAAVSNVRVLTEQGGNPDQVAQARQLSRSVGLPEPAVQENMQQVRAQEWGRATSSWLIDAPGTAQYLAEPQNAALSHDDVEGLRNIEMLRKQADAAPWWSQERRDLVHKLAQASVGEWDSTKAFREGKYRTNTLGPLYRRQYMNVLATGQEDPDLDVEIFRAEALAPERRAPEGIIDETVNAMFGQLPIWGNLLMERARGGIEGATAGAMAAAFGGPATVVLAPATALTGGLVGSNVRGAQAAFDLEADAAFGEFRKITDENGALLDPRIAAAGALAVGTINAYLENLGFKTFAGLLPGGMEAGRRVVNEAIKNGLRNKATQQAILGVLGKFGAAGATEGATEMGQELTNILFGELGKFVSEQIQGTTYADLDWGQAAQRIGQAGKEGMLAALGLGAGPTIASGIVQVRQAQSVQQFRNDQVALHDAILSSKTMQRDPVTMRNFGDILGIGEEVWIDAGTLSQRGPEFLQRIGVVPEVVEQAAADGYGIRLNTAELHYTLDQKEFSDLFEDIRPAPSAMSAREAAAYDPAQALKDIEEASVDIEATVAEVVQAKDRMRRSLEAVGLGDKTEYTWELATRLSRYASPKSDPLGFVKKLNVVAEGLASARAGQPVMRQVPPEVARELKYETRIPEGPIFGEAVANTPGAELVADGVELDLTRYQKEEQTGDTAVRSGVFYLPTGSKQEKYYRGGKYGYGGKVKVQGRTLLRAPLFVKGATGGKAPEAAYDSIMGKKAYENMRNEVLSAITGGGLKEQAIVDNIRALLDKYGATEIDAYEIYRNSKKGNTLAYAVQENIVAHAVRAAGYDAVVGYSKKKDGGAFISEVFDVREMTNPDESGYTEINERFYQQDAAYAGAENQAEIEEAGRLWAEKGTESPYFKRWSGGSKVVDESGKPLVVYHGTPDNAIDAFDPDRTGKGNDQLGSGFYFTSNEESAKGYARGDGSTTPSHLSIRNPIVLSEDQDNLNDVPLTAKQAEAIMLLAPDIFDADESPLVNWIDNNGKKFTKAHVRQVAVNYVDQMHALEGDIFGGDATAFRVAVNKATGHDGISKVFPNGERHYVAWFPTQIKSINNRGTFDPGDARILNQSSQRAAVPFFSAVERAITAMDFKAMPAKDLANRVKKTAGIKAEELEDLGLIEWLDGLGAEKVTKDQVAEFVRQGGPQIEEVQKGTSYEADDREAAYNEGLEQLSRAGAYDDRAVEIMDAWLADPNQDNTLEAEQLFIDAGLEWDSLFGGTVADRWSQGATKFSSYQLPGGENYREVLLTLPVDTAGEQTLQKEYNRLVSEGIPLFEAQRQAVANVPTADRYKSSHWDEPNVLAHVRLNDRTGPNGEKVLFIEEIQSDWHQAGRKKGYNVPPKGRSMEEISADIRAILSTETSPVRIVPARHVGMRIVEPALADRMTALYDELDARWDAEGKGKSLVPNAPFKKSWHLLAFKRVLRMAAEQGYDSVSWTPGEVQAERYDLSKQVNEIRVQGRTSGYTGEPDGRGVSIDLSTGRNMYLGVDEDGVVDTDRSGAGFEGKRLDEVVGKEMAEKIMRGEPNARYSGLDLKIGGAGMKGFYDKILPAEVGKYVKKWGVKVGETDVLGKAVWSIPLTDQMRQDILQGQPLYQSQKNDPRGSYSQLKDGRHLVTLLEKANASTMPHELAHAFLTEIRAVVESGAADQDMIDDLAKIESWLDKEAVDGSPEWQSYYEDALGRGLTEEAARADATFVLRHEKFSRGFEKYLWEGQAPTPELEGIFARFSRWMKRLYEDALAFGVTLNQEVRSVFDRMLKAEAEMESKVMEIGFTPMTEALAKHLGLGPDDRDYAVRLYTSALEKAEAKLIKARNKGLKKIRADWREEAVAAAKQSREHLMVLALRKGRGLDPEEYEFTYSDDPFSGSTSAEVERIRYALAEVDAELSGLAIVRDEELDAYEKVIGQIRKSGGIGYDSARVQIGAEGISDLRDTFGPGFVTANGQALDLLVDKLSEQYPEFGFDREVQNLIDWLQRSGKTKSQIRKEYSERKFELQNERKAGAALLAEAEGPVKAADKEKSASLRASVPSGVLKPGGMSSDEMAFEFGYDSGMEAMEALRAYRKPEDVAAEVVEAKTAEHDAKFVVEDYILDTKEFGAYQELMAKAYDKDGNVLSNRAFRDYARRIVASMPLADAMDVRSFLAAMARHHKAETKALKSGNLAAAAQANKKARLNHAYAQEALNVKKRVQKVEALAKRLGKLKAGKIEEGHHKALLRLLSRFEFTQKDYAGLQDVPALADLVKMKDAFGAEEEATFSAWLLSGGQQNYKDLTSGEFEELADLMKFLHGTGKDLVNPTLRASGLTMDEVRAIILPAMDKLPNRGKRRKEGTALRKIEDRVESYLSQNRTILWILRELDGYTALTGKTGPLESLLYDYLEAAQIKKAELSREMEKRTRSARTQLLKSAQAKPDKVSLVNLPVPAFWVRQGRVWDFDACLSVLMNMGNSVNKQRVMDGYGLSEADLQTILAVFSREDALAVQDIWSAMDDVLWPEIAKTHKSIRFFTPGKVQAEAFVMPDGTTLKGGYYPLKYDASADTRAAKNQDLDKAIQNPATAMLAKSVASGATKARAASAGGMPVMLRTSVLAGHLEWAAHYASHATIIHDLGRVLGDNKIAEAIKNTAGEETYRVANELVKRIANPRAGDAPSFLDRVFGRLTGISAVYGMWMNRFGPLTQPTAIGNYIVAEGGWGKGSAAWFKGAAHFLSAPGANWAWLMENNPALQSHFTLIRQKLTEAIGEDFRDIQLGKTKSGRIWTASKETVIRGGIAMYGVMDALVSVPGWYGSYLKGKDSGMSEVDAMTRANKVMAEYTPMFRDIDKTLFQHTKGMARAWTYMMSYFTKQANTNAGYWKAWRQGAIKTDQFIGQIIAVQLLPPLVVSMMYSMLTGDDDDRENVLLDAGLEVAAYPFAGLPFAREGAAFAANIARAAITGDSKQLGRNAFQMPGMMYFQLVTRTGSTMQALVQDLDDDEKQTKALMALLELTAASTGLPPVPKIAREIQKGLEDMDDDEGNILNVLIKPKFRKRD